MAMEFKNVKMSITNKIIKQIVIGVPCFNEEDNVFKMYKATKIITDKINKYNFSFLFVDNGSTDQTVKRIVDLALADKKVKGVFLSRNFGPESSIHAVMDLFDVQASALIMLPCDMQDPPTLIPKLISQWEDSFDLVLARYEKSNDSYFMTLMRKSFYSLFQVISNIEVPINVSGFGLFDKKVVLAITSLPEKFRFGRGLSVWVGFKRSYVSYERQERKYGKSSYSFFDYIKHSERGVFGFSYLPLDLMVYFGFLITLLSFLFILGYLVTVLFFGNPINASIPIMLAIVFFGGVNLSALSVIGKYIQVIVEESKNRPIYIVDKKINF
ncbi:MAG: glycosyltransferase family 2 protein, partial [bacterium]|nr:glycosyltransferase family 2 protein [bacterium]